MSAEFSGNDTVLGMHAPADFNSAEDDMPIAAYLDPTGHGVSAPYTTATNALLRKHLEEVKGTTGAKLNLSIQWKRHLRDFMGKKNNELLDFLKVTVEHHPTLGPGEVLLHRFGNPQVSPAHPSVRDMVLDVSGEDSLPEINAALKSLGGGDPLKDYALQTAAIYEMYKDAGDKVFQVQANLKRKLDVLDRINGKLQGLFEIDKNNIYEPLMKASEEYLQKIFEENTIADEYKALIAAYRRFISLRDIVSMSRSLLAQESEPICSICLEETVTYAITPCGHTFCQACSRRQHNTCFFCRTPIKEKVKLFFG